MAPWVEFSIFPPGRCRKELDVLKSPFIRNGQSLAALPPAGGKDPSAIGGGHAMPEPVLVLPFSSRWLKCSLHDVWTVFCLNSQGAAKIMTNWRNPNHPCSRPCNSSPPDLPRYSHPASTTHFGSSPGQLIWKTDSSRGTFTSIDETSILSVWGPTSCTTVCGNLTPPFSS